MGGVLAKKQVNKKTVFLLFILLVQFICNILIVGDVYQDQIHSRIEVRISNILQDVKFKDGTWDLSRYNADPNLLEKFPLYLIQTDGDILDRRSPIHGFLDQSDFNFLLSFTNIQTLTSANISRRVYSKPIVDNGKIIGVVAVSFLNPQKNQIENIDTTLKVTLEKILGKTQVKNGLILVNEVDERDIPYNISFTIVDKYNIVLKKTTNINSFNRIPTSLDSSYLKSLVKSKNFKIVRDQQTHEFFLIKTNQIVDKKGEVVGVLVVGQNLSSYILLLGKYTAFSSIMFFVACVFITIFFGFNSEDKTLIKRKNLKIMFDEKDSCLTMGNEKISILYSTNQFYFLQALFQKPEKRWETDELLERFGEDSKDKKSRKVYDTMIKLNQKSMQYASVKLIINENKTYKLNPQLNVQQLTHKKIK